VQVFHDEGVAVHIGPEPCVSNREVRGEASAGERIGQVWSRESFVWGADTVDPVEGDTIICAMASRGSARRGPRPWHVRTLFERKPGYLLFGHASGPRREGDEL
jgi:hypothetical protein